jgi:hypothetical protein
LASASGDLAVVVDGKEMQTLDRRAFNASLHAGAAIRMPAGGEVILVSERTLALQLLPGAELTLGSLPPPRWMNRPGRIEARAGEIRVTTGPRFAGTLRIETPNAVIEVNGTTLAVILSSEGTCVSVLEGTVRMGPRGGTPVPVDAGLRGVLFDHGRPPRTEPLADMERTKLTVFRDATMAGARDRAVLVR